MLVPMYDNATGQDTTTTTRHDAPQRDSATTILSVADTAQLLGISPGAVRKRIERGQLAARKVRGQWHVILDAAGATGQDTTTTTRHDVTDTTPRHNPNATGMTSLASDAARSQLEAIRDEWLAPLISQITEQAERIGHLEAEKTAAEQARDLFERQLDEARSRSADLEGEVTLLRLQLGESNRQIPGAGVEEQENDRKASRPWWRLWQRD